MSEFRRDVKAPLEPYTPNMYASPGRERALQAVRQGMRLTGRVAARGLSTVSRKMPDVLAAAARTSAGIAAGATMYALTGENDVAAASAFQAASIADRAMRSGVRAGGALYRGGERFVRWDLGRIDAETARRVQAAPRATARFRETLRGGNFPGPRTV